MATIRLDKMRRKNIRNDLLRHRFGKSVDQLMADMVKFAERAHNHVYKKSARDRMEALPKGWLKSSESIGITFEPNGYTRLHFNGVTGIYGVVKAMVTISPDVITKLVPYKDIHNSTTVLAEDHTLSRQYAALKERLDRLRADLDDAAIVAESAIKVHSTLASLIKAWPEVEPFTRKYNVPKVQLPAPLYNAVNRQLGLPITDKESVHVGA